MKWKEFRSLSEMEKLEIRKKKTKADTQRIRLFKELEKAGIEIPDNDPLFKAAWHAWGLYSIANTTDRMKEFLSYSFEIKGEQWRASNAALALSKFWRDIFYGFVNARAEFVPGIISILMMDYYDDPIEAYLINTDLSQMSVDQAVAEISMFIPSITSEVLRQRCSSWD